MKFDFDEKKNAKLFRDRSVTFFNVIDAIENDEII